MKFLKWSIIRSLFSEIQSLLPERYPSLLPLLAAFIFVSIFIVLRSEFYQLDQFAGPNPHHKAISWCRIDTDDIRIPSPRVNTSEKKEPVPRVPKTHYQIQMDEYAARTLWHASNVLYWFPMLVLYFVTVRILYRTFGRKAWRLFAVTGVVTVVLIQVMDQGNGVSAADTMDKHARALAGLNCVESIDKIENYIVLPLCLLFALAAGSLSAATLNYDSTPEHLKQKADELNELLNIGAVFMVLAVFHLWTQWGWSISLLCDSDDRAFARLAVNAMTFSLGTVFSCVLGAIYFTAMGQIRLLARRAIRHEGVITESETQKRLDDNGIGNYAFNDLSSLAKVLSPLLAAGPVAQLLGFIGSK